MRCLHCDREIPQSFFEEWSRTEAVNAGRFSCPHCLADHVRREIGRLPSGELQYSIRLWGHLSEIRRKQKPKDPGTG